MAVTGKLYGKMFLAAFNKEIDLPDDVIKCMLTTSSYTPDQDAHDYKDDVTNEVTGTGYTAGGTTLGNRGFTYTGATNVLAFTADPAVWTAATITARTAVVYDSTPGSDATRPLICYQQSDVDIVSTNGTFQVTWNASGIFTITVA